MKLCAGPRCAALVGPHSPHLDYCSHSCQRAWLDEHGWATQDHSTVRSNPDDSRIPVASGKNLYQAGDLSWLDARVRA